MPKQAPPQRRVVVMADMNRYSRQDNLRQYQSQQAFRRILKEAATASGIRPARVDMQPAGDGALLIMPADTPEPAVLGRFVPAIDRLLREYNRGLLPDAKVRLRIAVNVGLVHLDGAMGFPGDAIVATARLQDADTLKYVLRHFADAEVAQIVSEAVYHDVVAQRYEDLRPEKWRRIQVDKPDKDFTSYAWIHVPGEDTTALDKVLDSLGTPPEPSSGPDLPPAGAARKPDDQGPRGGGGSQFSFGEVHTQGPTVFGDGGQAWTTDTGNRPDGSRGR